MKNREILVRLPLVLASIVVALSSADGAEPGKTLSLDDRIEAQRAIEQVYWSLRIWPKENPGPKPLLSTVMPEAQLRAKVEDYLKKSNALEAVWQRPITAEQLQAELDRMARDTRDGATLQALFRALDNDPFLIAETLARQTLADRLVRDWYSSDRKFHRELKAQVEAALAECDTVDCMRTLGGQLDETTWRRRAAGDSEKLATQQDTVMLDDDEWNRRRTRLIGVMGATGDGIRVGQLSALIESADAFSVTAVRSQSSEEYRTATVTWPKRSFDLWWSETSRATSGSLHADRQEFTLPSAPSTTCVNNSWTETPFGAPNAWRTPAGVWTGSEMIVVGGEGATDGRYNPATNAWSPTSNVNSPRGHVRDATFWTGTEVIAWGGTEGAKYNPVTDTWTPMATSGAPSKRFGYTAVWTGSVMIVWGGVNIDFDTVYFNTGARYNPASNTWSPVSTGANVPEARYLATAVWTGSVMIVWGGSYAGIYLNTGGRYDPIANTWTTVSTGSGSPSGREEHTAIWTGTEMIVWGGHVAQIPVNTGSRYNPSSNTWTGFTGHRDLPARYNHTAVWTGTDMIVWGGQSGNSPFTTLATGGRYDPTTNTWTLTRVDVNTPVARVGHAAVWTGTEMIVWGGWNEASTALNTGARYNPANDSWLATPSSSAVPAARTQHSAVWTGDEMIVWGGLDPDEDPQNTGARYRPATATWTPTSASQNVPLARTHHSAVWTGREMIVWGGNSSFTPQTPGTGARYNPLNDTWTEVSTANAPTRRLYNTAVWTGNAMIVWGGTLSQSDGLNTGGVYRPDTDTWTATSLNGEVPQARWDHTAVWTGNEMIVWGGRPNQGSSLSYMNSGARYNPVTDSWVPTPVNVGTPSPRKNHTAVWTGTQMLVWGGNIHGPINTARYSPSTDAWSSVSSSVSSETVGHTATWTGAEMLVWGGDEYDVITNSGWRYNPVSNSWSAMAADSNIPSPRTHHTAVWTGTQLIVWGGEPNDSVGGLYCACANGGLFYRDADGDGFGDPAISTPSCSGSIPTGYVGNDTDCNDTNDAINPGETETCNLVDDNCDGTVDGPDAQCSDGNACTQTDACVNGACVGSDPVTCVAVDSCHLSGVCDPATGCSNPTAPDGTSCSDGDACTIDACESGVCRSAPVHCDDGDPSTTDTCDPATGTCVHIGACGDGDPCTIDSFDSGTGQCIYTPIVCDDGVFCNGVETCVAGACVSGSPVNCDDGNVCTDDACTATGCAYSNNTAPCDDGSSCTSGDSCQSGVCVGNISHPTPKTKGHYKKLCKRNELTEAQGQCVAQTAPQTFGDVDTVMEVCDELDGHDSELPSHDSDEKHCTKDETELIVLALNICTGRVCASQPIDSQHGDNTTVQESLDEADQIFSDPARDKDTCHEGRELAKEINNGKALRMDTLQLNKVGNNGVVLVWTPPFLDDEQSVIEYEIWRSVRGEDAFVRINTRTTTSYVDDTAGEFDYEVLVEIQE